MLRTNVNRRCVVSDELQEGGRGRLAGLDVERTREEDRRGTEREMKREEREERREKKK